MGFIRTADEIAELEALHSRPRFYDGERLNVEFTTTPEALARLLPPPLEPTDRPTAVVGIGRWRSDAVGPYSGGSIYLASRHGETKGLYALSMWMDTEPAVLYGREVFGEPKKFGVVTLDRRQDRVTATVVRHDTTIVEIHATLGEDRGPSQATGRAFNFRSRPAADGIGLAGDPELTEATFEASASAERIGAAELTLRGTAHDPLEELPIVSVGQASYTAVELIARCQAVATVPAEAFLPFHYGRGDDWLALDP
ncbi:MAG: acetoacetate decarboxylase family protein [Actinobacteria bacterium]|nr:acetoacetate decarboxylase family protein [Actinomycetota bacterium]